MRNPRWNKLWRDLWLARGRTAMMVMAIGVSIFGVGTILSGYAILNREISRNYLSTNPASATLAMDQVDDALAEAVRKRPGIADAEARASVMARVQVGRGTWRPLLLFVVKDFNAMRIARFRPESGEWPPSTGSMLVERTALEMVQGRPGQTVVVKTPNGPQRAVLISGVVHDRGLGPAPMEGVAYGYVTPQTLETLGESGTLNELKIVVTEQQADAAAIERTARELADWLQQQGGKVYQIQIPPPLEHPHQSHIVAVTWLLIVFAMLALVLSAVLVATMISGLLAQQTRQIGVMKAVGAQRRQIAGLYIVMILLISVAAIAVGSPTGVLMGRAFSEMVGEHLNFTIFSAAIPWWVFAVQAAAGLLIPLLVALGPITWATRITVRAAISDFGVSQEKVHGGRLVAWLGTALRWADQSVILALRNTFRRRGRLVLTLALLAVGGAMFMTGLNVKAASDKALGDLSANRHFDFEVYLTSPQDAKALVERLGSVPGVAKVEPWNSAATALAQLGGIDVVRTYPDGSNGSLNLRAGPADSRLVTFPMTAGRWLAPGDTDAVVLNQNAAARIPGVAVGDSIQLSVAGRPTAWRVVGLVKEIGSANAYVTSEGFDRVSGYPGKARSLRIVAADRDPAEHARIIRAIENRLAEEKVSVANTVTDADFRSASSESIAIITLALIMVAIVMGTVGALGLTSTMSTNVAERTREFGVMQAIGGTARSVIRIVVTEGTFVGVLGWLVALPLSVPFSAMVGMMIGDMALGIPLPLVISASGVLLWLAVSIIGSAAASALPAWLASRLTVRETLASV